MDKKKYLIDQREKLALLIVSDLPEKDQKTNATAAEKLADHLIAKGVTVTDTNVGKWIPVTERLPEKSGDYLGYCGDGYIGLLPYSTQYKLFNTFDGCGTKHAMAVTHWMPLPEPPKGE